MEHPSLFNGHLLQGRLQLWSRQTDGHTEVTKQRKEREGKKRKNIYKCHCLMSFQFKHNTIIYIYLQLSTLFADTILWLSSFFPHVATIKKKNVRIIFERNNKYNNFIKGLTKALALIHLQIAIHI